MKKYFRTSYKIKRLTALLLAVCLMLPLTLSGGVSGRTAADINEQIRLNEEATERLQRENQQREQRIKERQGDLSDLVALRKEVERQIAGVKERIDLLTEIIELQQESIENKQGEIEVLEMHIEDTEAEIERREIKIAALDAENEENKEKFAQLVKNNYMSGSRGYIDLFLNATSFFDLIVRADVFRKVGERNVEFMEELLAAIAEQEREIEELEALKAQLDADRITCEEEKADLERALEELERRMDELDEEMETEQTKLRGFASDIEDLQSTINSMFRQYNATNEEIEALEAEVTKLIKELQNLARPNFSGDGFIWPLDHRFTRVTDNFGWTTSFGGRNHRGVDIGNAGIGGANIYAMQSGTVIIATFASGYGNYMVIDHGGGISTLYAHMRNGSMRFSSGDAVTQGDVIGLVGSTGWSTGNHLHFEFRENGTAVSPWDYVTRPS